MLQTVLLFLILVHAKTAFALSTISISGNPAPMTISTAVAGGQPQSVTNSSTTYSIISALANTKITGQLNQSMPSGTTLKVSLQAPLLGGTSQGSVAMSTTAADLVTNIPILSLTGALTITYTLSATVAASPVSNSSVILTLTIQ